MTITIEAVLARAGAWLEKNPAQTRSDLSAAIRVLHALNRTPGARQVLDDEIRRARERLAIIQHGGYAGRLPQDHGRVWQLNLVFGLFAEQAPGVFSPADLDRLSQVNEELETTFQAMPVDAASQANPSFASSQSRPDFSRVMRGLVEHIAGDLPPETSAVLGGLKFSVPRLPKVSANVSNYLGSWAGDVETLWRVLSDDRLDPDTRFRVAKKIIDYIQLYAGFGRSSDKTHYKVQPFQFRDLTLETFNKGAVVKGKLEPEMSLQKIKELIAARAISVTPQGEALLKHLTKLTGGNSITVGLAFGALQKIQIQPFKDKHPHHRGHDGSVVVGDKRLSAAEFSEHVTERESFDREYGTHKFGSLIPTSLEEARFLAGENGSHQWVAGDGLAGEIGFHLLRELAAAGASVYSPDVNLERSQVAAGAVSLGLLLDQIAHHDSDRSELLLRSGQIFVGAANVMEPDRMAATLDALMPAGEKALYVSMAYAAGRQMEPLLVEGGALAARSLIAHDRVAGVLRLQSPSTPSLRKSDIARFQGPWYLLAQFLKLAAALEENGGKTPSFLPRWPIVRTRSLMQNKFVAAIIDEAPHFGVRTASPAEAGSEAFIPAKAILRNQVRPSIHNVRPVNDGGVTSHRHDLSRMIAQAAVRTAAQKAMPTFMRFAGR